jgi:catechol 2,3-dioxygenase-like lactoylglutathione lyase family enzyme
MTNAFVEHANFTVSEPEATAKWMCDVFGWHIRWQGSSIFGGRSVHVGGAQSYLALYNMGDSLPKTHHENYHHIGGLNHIGIVVDDLDAAEAKIEAAGFTTHSHADYEPGRRFYFHDRDGIEFEVISYN